MISTEEAKQVYIKNFNTLKLYLTDIVAAEESGFGSQPITTLNNWIVGHIIFQRSTLLGQIGQETSFALDWSAEETKAYSIKAQSNSHGQRISYKRLLTDLNSSQLAVLATLDCLDLNQSEFLNTMISRETEGVLELSQHNRQNGKTGIY